MNEQREEHGLIESMLALLSQASNNPEAFKPTDGQSADFQAAEEVIRFMDEMPGGFLIYHADDAERIIYANEALLRLFLCESMEEFRALTGNSFKGMVHPEDLEPIEQSIAEQVASSQYDLDYVEYRIIQKDGGIRWVDDYGHFVRSRSAGDIFYVFIGDATEKRDRLFNERLENEQKLQSLIEEYNQKNKLIQQEHLQQLEVIEGLGINYDSILYADLDADKILPYRLSSRTKKQFDEKFQIRSFLWYTADYVHTWVHPEEQEMVSRATSPEYIRKRLSGSKTYSINYRVLFGKQTQYLQLRIVDVGRRTGRKRHISQIVFGYRRIDGEFQREMEQKRMLEEALEKARLAIVAKNTFLSNMSHDIRTPLNAVFGFTALIKKNIEDPKAVQRYLNKIEIASKQLLGLFDKVLELSWAESRDSITETECSIYETMDEIYQFLLPQSAEKDIVFSMDCSGLKHDLIYGDQEKLKRLLLYLVNNAVTYTQAGGRVDMSVTELEDPGESYASYQFVIKDTGVGISEDFLQHIFEPFERERNTTLSGIHGIGLGLTIAKNIVDTMDGSLSVESTVGKGSVFTVTLRFRIPTLPSPFTAGSPVSRKLPALSLLLVEDNEINQEIEAELLEELGFKIDTADNGSIAVEKVRRSQPGDYDLVLMDIQMPVMNGWQAAQAIRRIENPALARIPIIALSANAFESDRQTSLESGMQAHLTKPLDIPELLETVTRVMQKAKNNPDTK